MASHPNLPTRPFIQPSLSQIESGISVIKLSRIFKSTLCSLDKDDGTVPVSTLPFKLSSMKEEDSALLKKFEGILAPNKFPLRSMYVGVRRLDKLGRGPKKSQLLKSRICRLIRSDANSGIYPPCQKLDRTK